jgi:hypothetical protein
MTDFSQKSSVKSAVRKLATPIADYAKFDALVSSVVSGNPWGCTAYTSAGASKPAVQVSSETYGGSVVFNNAEAKKAGTVPFKSKTYTGLTNALTEIEGNSVLKTSLGVSANGTSDSSEHTFSRTLKCHDPNGEIYTVTFKRDQIVLTSYENDAILTKVETWADGITDPSLA